MPRYKLRTLLILLAIVPILIWWLSLLPSWITAVILVFGGYIAYLIVFLLVVRKLEQLEAER